LKVTLYHNSGTNVKNVFEFWTGLAIIEKLSNFAKYFYKINDMDIEKLNETFGKDIVNSIIYNAQLLWGWKYFYIDFQNYIIDNLSNLVFYYGNRLNLMTSRYNMRNLDYDERKKYHNQMKDSTNNYNFLHQKLDEAKSGNIKEEDMIHYFKVLKRRLNPIILSQ